MECLSDKHMDILITGIFTILGLIIGAGLTLLVNRSQLKAQ